MAKWVFHPATTAQFGVDSIVADIDPRFLQAGILQDGFACRRQFLFELARVEAFESRHADKGAARTPWLVGGQGAAIPLIDRDLGQRSLVV